MRVTGGQDGDCDKGEWCWRGCEAAVGVHIQVTGDVPPPLFRHHLVLKSCLPCAYVYVFPSPTLTEMLLSKLLLHVLYS